MSIFSGILVVLGPLIGPISKWSERRDAISQAKADAAIAEIKAKAEIAGYKVKADIEWDLKWADQASTSFKDELISLVLFLPLIMLFVPPLAPYAVTGFENLKIVLGEYATQWYAGALTLVVVSTYGMKSAIGLLMPGRVAKMVQALGSVPDDIPDVIAHKANIVASQHMKDAEG